MKIEMGESLFYSWLRHAKECQIVQLNWKPSPSWEMRNEKELKSIMDVTDAFFQKKHDYDIYKNNSLSQLLRQAEVDALGISMSGSETEIYAIDVAFHEAGLNYGSRQETVERVIKKFIRTFLCIKAYFDITKGEIVFASPRIHNKVLEDLEPCLKELNTFLSESKHNFKARVIANDGFNELVLKPILIVSEGVSDTSELFMRGYQLINLFSDTAATPQKREDRPVSPQDPPADALSELKVGKIARTYLRKALEEGKADEEEVGMMQTKEYSKKQFGINYPLLVLADGDFDTARYYSNPLNIGGVQYHLCSQWYETPANNDRLFLLDWLEKHDCV